MMLSILSAIAQQTVSFEIPPSAIEIAKVVGYAVFGGGAWRYVIEPVVSRKQRKLSELELIAKSWQERAEYADARLERKSVELREVYGQLNDTRIKLASLEAHHAGCESEKDLIARELAAVHEENLRIQRRLGALFTSIKQPLSDDSDGGMDE